ncbi:MAG: WXG100 family type VII secretion target [Eubacteriales bacterium]|nr:WXG100 family type VII secretion target [Eubacteriales bacterium]
MAANKIKVNTNSLSQTQKELQARLKKIRSDIENISNDMNTLSSMWSGDAHEAFDDQIASDIGFLNEVCKGIDSIISFEGTAVTEYNKCEEMVGDLVAQIRV